MARPLTASQKAALAAEIARQAAAAAKKNKPKPTPSAGRRTNPKAAKPKPAPKPAARAALPPGRQGGAIVRQGNAKPENPRRTDARNRQATAGRGTTGPGRVGQPAGSANRMFGANVVNRSVNRALRTTRLAGLGKAVGKVALPAAIATQAMDVVGGFQKLANHPFLKGKDTKPTPSDGRRTNPKAAKPKPKLADIRGTSKSKFADLRSSSKPGGSAPAAARELPKPTPKPTVTKAAAPSPRKAAPTSAKPKPKAPAKAKPPAASKPTVAQTSGTGPLKSGAAYASRKGSISESVRQLREMRAASKRRQTGQAAPALSSSKNYSSQFKDMKGGSSRFASELKKKKKPKK